MRNLTHTLSKLRLFSQNKSTFFQFSRKCRRDLSLFPPSGYALVVIRKYRIPLFTKFAIVKLKSDLFIVSMIFLKRCSALDPVDTGRKLNVNKTFRRRPGHFLNVLCTFNLRPVSTGAVVCCLFLRALFTYSTMIKKKCKASFSTNFRVMKLKADASSFFLIFISMNK